jgi:hypothetical protein
MGHTVGKMLAMAYVDTGHSWPGNNLIVEINGRPVPAKVTPTPFFDPENARVRSEPQEDERRLEHALGPVASANSRSNASVRQSSDRDAR